MKYLFSVALVAMVFAPVSFPADAAVFEPRSDHPPAPRPRKDCQKDSPNPVFCPRRDEPAPKGETRG